MTATIHQLNGGKTMTKSKAPRHHNLSHLTRDTGYRFTDRDPMMEELCDIIDKSGMAVTEICKEVTKATGGAYNVANSTVYNWLNGKTKRPQNYTLTWVGFALGYERKWTKL